MEVEVGGIVMSFIIVMKMWVMWNTSSSARRESCLVVFGVEGWGMWLSRVDGPAREGWMEGSLLAHSNRATLRVVSCPAVEVRGLGGVVLVAYGYSCCGKGLGISWRWECDVSLVMV